MNKIFTTIYFISLCLLVLLSYTFIDPQIIYMKFLSEWFFVSDKNIKVLLLIGLFCWMYIQYILLIYIVNKNKLSKKNLILLVGGTVSILLFSYSAMLSYDIYNYIATSKILFLYKENPYIVMPIHVLNEPLLSFMHASNKVALYGPMWIITSGIPLLFGLNNFILTIVSFKVFNIICYLLTLFLIYKFTKNYYSVVFFAFNPLIIVEMLVSSHNDIVMIFLALLSFYLLQNKKIILSTVVLFLSILVKYATIFLIPVFIYVFYLMYKKKTIQWNTIYLYSAIFMVIPLLFAPIREEIYPWYFSWILVFVAIFSKKYFIHLLCISISFSLLLRYIPFLITGTHFEYTPIIKIVITFIIPLFFTLFYIFTNKLWLKKLFHI